jgi:hypothetical protein
VELAGRQPAMVRVIGDRRRGTFRDSDRRQLSLAGKPWVEVSKVILGQRGQERGTRRIASHCQEYQWQTKRPPHGRGGKNLDQKLAKLFSYEAERLGGTDEQEQWQQHSRRMSNLKREL